MHITTPHHSSASRSGQSITRLVRFVQAWAQQWWEKLNSPATLQIWQFQDQHGVTYWSAYDPVSGRCTTVTSEADLVAWIERSEPMGEVWPSQTAANPFLYPLAGPFPPHC